MIEKSLLKRGLAALLALSLMLFAPTAFASAPTAGSDDGSIPTEGTELPTTPDPDDPSKPGDVDDQGELDDPDDGDGTEDPEENDLTDAEDGVEVEADEVPVADADEPLITYDAHVQNIGWQNGIAEGETAGTTGRSLRVEALRLKLNRDEGSTLPEGTIEARSHVQNIGWQSWTEGSTGTTGRGLRMEALQIRLTGDLASKYHVYYRVHVQNIGWMNWAKDEAEAGTAGQALRIEAVEIMLVPNGEAGPSGDGAAFEPIVNTVGRSHVQNVGWSNGTDTFGTTGRGLRVEALELNISGAPVSGGIAYKAHVQNIGWQGEASDGATAGTEGRSLRMEAIQIRLTGDMANKYNVYYRTHCQNLGWLGWAKNGQTAGTTGVSYRMEAVQILIRLKSAPAPGANANYFKDGNALRSGMDSRINGYSSSTNWLLAVDTNTCRVGVYQGRQGHWSNVKYWACSPGKNSTPTKKGVFKVQNKGYSFGHGYTCYYWTQFSGNYLFHSVLYNQGTWKIKDGRLGQRLSAGCVRLDASNAKWIQDNIPRNTAVVIW